MDETRQGEVDAATPAPDLGATGVTRIAHGVYRTASPQATTTLGRLLASALRPGDVIVLSGDLGAGKTCFTGGVAAGLGDQRPVTSPTFTIMAVHDGGRIPLYHYDLYRLDDAEQLEDVGIYDMLEGDGACLVEWGERFAGEIGDDRLDLVFTRLDASAADAGDEGEAVATEPARQLVARPHGERAHELLDAFDDAVRAALAG